MISCRLAGGLGNMMFQIAATSSAAWKHRDEPVFYLHENWGMVHKMPHEYQDTIFRKIRRSSSPLVMWPLQEYLDHPYKELPYTKHTLRNGYFQSEKFFIEHEEKIHNLFAPRQFDIDHINTTYGNLLKHPCISIHIRRGDYENLEHNHPILPLSYYSKAIDTLPSCEYILVFSDDMAWCKQNLKDLPYSNKLKFVQDDDFIELYLMSMCTYNIIANSTFSWWAAWLNKAEDKQVIAPSVWFGPNLSHVDTKDLLPEGWLILSI